MVEETELDKKITSLKRYIGRRIQTSLDPIKPSLEDRADQTCYKQKILHDRHSKEREFTEGDTVWVLNTHGEGYISGVITSRTGPLSYRVKLETGLQRRSHADQIKGRSREIHSE